MFVHIIPHCDFKINNIYIIDKFIRVKMDNHYFFTKENLWLKYLFWIFSFVSNHN